MAQGISQEELWHAAVDVLVRLRSLSAPTIAGEGTSAAHRMPVFDAGVMRAELALICDWFWPHAFGHEMPASERLAFESAWSPYLEQVTWQPSNRETSAWLLRDYHSPNLIWIPSRDGLAKVGIIDFQDAQIGHAAYDLVSLSLDARLDVPMALHEALIDHYCAKALEGQPAFDETAFRRAVAILGAQRNTKILGIFARLAVRDGKDGYLRHIPRIKRYLGWCLEHPDLESLRTWYTRWLDFD
jgi:aminoglycoside/choline kinase family phosphotransferase